MKNKKIKIALNCIFIALMILIVGSQIAFAWEPNYDVLENKHAQATEDKVYTILGAVINIVSVIGAGIAILMLIWLGIRLVNTYGEGGGPRGRAELKKEAPRYVIGAILIFSASALLKIIQVFVDGNINT